MVTQLCKSKGEVYMKPKFKTTVDAVCHFCNTSLKNPLIRGSPIPFLIIESHKIIWPFHASREIENKISRSRKSQNSNSRGRKIDLHQKSRIMEK